MRFKTTKREFTSFLMCRTTQMYFGSKCTMQYVPVMVIVMLNVLAIEAVHCYGALIPVPMDGMTYLIHKWATKWDFCGISEQYRFTSISWISLSVILVCCVALCVHVLSMWSSFTV